MVVLGSTEDAEGILAFRNEADSESEPLVRATSSRLSAFRKQATFKRGAQSIRLNSEEVNEMIGFMDDHEQHKRSSKDNSEAHEHNSAPGSTPDAEQAWKAKALRALRGAEDGAMTLDTLIVLAPNPTPATPFEDLVRSLLVERMLARWVVENESIQLMP